jgi:uncharacterized membrane-anchored protein
MKSATATALDLSKVPALTVGLWLIKIAAATLGETGGDWVSMSHVMRVDSLCRVRLRRRNALMQARKRPRPTVRWLTCVLGAGGQFVRAPRTDLRLLYGAYLPLEFDGLDGLTAVRCRYDEA